MECRVNGKYLSFTIEKEETIQAFLERYHLSKKSIHLLKQYKNYTLNGEYVNSDTVMKKNDVLCVLGYEEDDGMYPPVYGELDIVYEDDYLLVINKPPFINIYPDDQSKTDSLCNIVSYYYKKKRLNIPVRYIHRLDYKTSGLVIFVKCFFILALMDYQLSIKEIHRDYLAIVEGNFNKNRTVNSAIGNDRHANKMRVAKNGKEATTIIKKVSLYKDLSLIHCILKTGRKHQIRVHLSSIGYPIVGDDLYGTESKLINRQALHAYKVSFVHPISNKLLEIECDLPEDMKVLLTDE